MLPYEYIACFILMIVANMFIIIIYKNNNT